MRGDKTIKNKENSIATKNSKKTLAFLTGHNPAQNSLSLSLSLVAHRLTKFFKTSPYKHFDPSSQKDARASSPSSSAPLGSQVFRLLGPLTSHNRSSRYARLDHSSRRSSRYTTSHAQHAHRLALPILSVSALMFGSFLFSHSAYAASYLNVSSSAPEGLVKFSKVQPSSTGEMSTAEDTLTVNTNCTVGYSVYVSAINGGDTNLTNDSASASGNNTIAPSSATVGGTAAVLSANTWGINGSSSEVEDGKYFGLPTYASATASALTTRSNVAEQTTVPIYYGAKVTTAIAPGSYAGDVLYTVLSDSACNVYTIEFDANGGTGEMDNQTINVGQATALNENEFTREGYTFLGWSTESTGKTGTAVDGVGTAEDVDYENEASVTDISSFNTTKTLYAIWEAAADGDMQTWTGCSALSINQSVRLRDNRGTQKIYTVKKLADNNCWMMENLSISNVVMTDQDTNLAPNATFDLTADITYSGSSGWCYDNSSTCDDVKAVYIDSVNGGYYNWYTATASNGTFSTATEATINYDICPKGWRLPVGGNNDTSNQFVLLDKALGGTGENRDSANTYSALTNIFPLAGYIYGSLSGVGTRGYWWSSTAKSYSAYFLGLYLSGQFVYPLGSYHGKYRGSSVRCIAQNNYTVSYNANGGSGAASKASDTIYETGEVTTAGQGTLNREGYNFLGWSLDQNATSATYSANIAISVPDLITAAGSPASGSTITLYAVWEKYDGDMQTWTGCASLSTGQSVKLRDTRDNKVYTVKKLPDGKCWMMQNLTIGSDGAKTLTSADTNIDNNTTYYLPPAGKQGDITSSSTLTSTTAANFSSSNDNQAKTQFRTKNTSYTNDSDTGYYNFYTATLGYAYYGSGSSGSSTRDICPKGWRLPKTTDAGGTVSAITSVNDFTYLTRQYSTSNWSGTATSSNYGTTNSAAHTGIHTGVAANGNNYAGFSYSGYWYGTYTSASIVGSNGLYWSSSVYSTSDGYYLDFNSSNVRPQYVNNKNYGHAVRCIAKETMQEFKSSELTSVGDSKTLIDARDGKEYTVKKLPDGKVWMMQNLTIGSDGAKTLTSADTNIDNNTTYYLPPAGKQGDITSSSTLTSTTAADFSSSNDNQAKTQFRTKDSSITNDSDTGYYNFYTATLGFSYYNDGKTSGSSTRDICPKGWHLPTGGASGQFVALDIAMNDGTGNNRTDTTARDRFLNDASFLYSGYYNSSQLYGVGSNGNWWSSTVYSTNNGYYLSLYSNGSVYPQYDDGKCFGFAVRCMAD